MLVLTNDMWINNKILDTFSLKEPQKKALKRLKLETINDLLYHFPFRYDENFEVVKIKDTQLGQKVTIFGNIKNLKTGKTFKGRRAVANATLEDGTGKIKITWFAQPYIAKMFEENDLVKVDGTVTDSGTLTNPKIEKVESGEVNIGGPLFENGDETHFPVYPESRGITSNWFYHAIQKIFKSGILDELEETIPEEVLEKYNFYISIFYFFFKFFCINIYCCNLIIIII